MNGPLPPDFAAAAVAEEANTRRAMLHLLEDLQRERDIIRTAHQEWLSTVDAVRDPLMAHDLEGRIVRANRAYAERAGVGFRELVGRPYWECFPRRAGAGVLQDGEELVLEGGEIFIAHVHPAPDAEGRPSGWIYLFEDVTNKRHAERRRLEDLQRSQTYSHALDAISSSKALLEGSVEQLAREITERVAAATGVERANVWLFSEDEDELRCIDLYEAAVARHSSGVVLTQAQFRNEFDALKRAPYVDADDPLTDPRTAGYVETYLKPLGITSMLDAVVRVAGKNLGLLCLEHVGKPHHWDREEITFACRVADKIALAISNRDRQRAQLDLERRERYFRKLIEGSTDAFLVVDRRGSVLYRSESGKQITGYEKDEVVGKPFTQLMTPESLIPAREALARRVRNPEVSGRVELQLARKDGSVAEVEVMGKNLLADPDVGGIVVTLHDISERKRAERRIHTLNTLYATLSAVNHAIVQSKTRQEVCERIVHISTEVGLWQGAWIGFADPQTKRIVPQAWSPAMAAHIDKLAVSIDAAVPEGRGPTGTAVRSGVPYFCNDVLADPLTAPWQDFARSSGTNSVAAIPLQVAGMPPGVVNLYSREKEIFTPEVRALVIEMGDDISYALEMQERELQRRAAESALQEHQAKLRHSLEGTVEAIAAIVETRDPYTAGHQRHVADLARAIGGEMGLSEQVQEGLHFGALIHDLGKVQVPAEILSKPTKLTKLEFELIKVHPQAGYDIVKNIEFPWPVADMVHQHHERLDGSGYPQGLKGDAIVLEARVLAVADVVEAMASHRPYRPGLGIEAALKEIEAKRGIWFDPAAVDACLRLFREKNFSLGQGSARPSHGARNEKS